MNGEDDLLRLIPPPIDIAADIDWETLEERLGVRLPSDYKWLVEHYGPGKFSNFLHILQPVTGFAPIRLEDSANRASEILDQLRESGENIPYPTEELLPVGTTDNGDTIYWVRRPEVDPDRWPIVANAARNTKWPEFDGGIVQFLVATLSGRYRCEVFPDSFPGDEPVFSKYVTRASRRNQR